MRIFPVLILGCLLVSSSEQCSCSNKRQSQGLQTLYIRDVKTWIDTLIEGLPGKNTEAYIPPEEFQLTVFGEAVRLFIKEDWENAKQVATAVHYTVNKVQDQDSQMLYALMPSKSIIFHIIYTLYTLPSPPGFI